MKQIENVLIHLAKELNGNRIIWALGGSLLLYYKGFDVKVNDIDILVDINSHDQLKEVLKPYPYTYVNSNPKYQTEHFYQFTINQIDIDLMINFRVKTKSGLYKFPFDNSCISGTVSLEGEAIYLSSLEEWQKAYIAMNRLDKIKLF